MDTLKIIKVGTTFFRRNLISILSLTLLAHLPYLPVQIIALEKLKTADLPSDPFANVLQSLWIHIDNVVIYLFWVSVLLVAVYRLLSEDLPDRPPDLFGALSYAFGHFFPIVLTKILMSIFLVVALIAGFFVLGIFFVMGLLAVWALVNPIMAVEGVYFIPAMKRSWKLMFRSPVFLNYLLIYGIYYVLTLFLGIFSWFQVLPLIRGLFAGSAPEVSRPSLFSSVISQVLSLGIQSVLIGWLACVIFVFYLHLKARFEPPPEVVEPTPESPESPEGF